MIIPDRSRSPRDRTRRRRAGQAAVEMAILTPVLVFVNLITIDFARVYYYSGILSNCARNGAIWASDSTAKALSPYTTVSQAALADASDFATQPTITGPVNGTDSSGNAYVEVTATYTFSTIVTYPGIPSTTALSRKARVRVAPSYTY